MKSRMSMYNLTGKDDIWWQDIKRVKNIKEKYVTWTFKKYFKRIFLSQQYYHGGFTLLSNILSCSFINGGFKL